MIASASLRFCPRFGRRSRDIVAGHGSLLTLRWRGQSPANPSLESDSLVTGKNTGNLSRIATGTLLILRDIKDLPIECPSRETGNFSKPSSQLIPPFRVVSPQIRVNG